MDAHVGFVEWLARRLCAESGGSWELRQAYWMRKAAKVIAGEQPRATVDHDRSAPDWEGRFIVAAIVLLVCGVVVGVML